MKLLATAVVGLSILAGCARPEAPLKTGAQPGVPLNPKQKLLGSWTSANGVTMEFKSDGTCRLVAKGTPEPVDARYRWVDATHIQLSFQQGGRPASNRSAVRFVDGKLHLKGDKEPKEMVFSRAEP